MQGHGGHGARMLLPCCLALSYEAQPGSAKNEILPAEEALGEDALLHRLQLMPQTLTCH